MLSKLTSPFKSIPIWAWAWTLIFLVIGAVPYVAGLFLAPDGATFSGVLLNPLDTNSYLANMQLGHAGRWRYVMPYTAPQSEPVPLFMVYILLGHAARLVGLALPLVFHLARIACGGLFALSAYHFIAFFLPDAAERKTAFGLLLFTGGMGWIMIVIRGANLSEDKFEIADLWISDAISFTALMSNPHFTLNMVLIMVLIVVGGRFVRSGSGRDGWRDGLLAVLAGAGIALIHAHQLAVVGLVLGLDALFTSPLNPLSKYGEGTYPSPDSPSPRVERGPGGEVIRLAVIFVPAGLLAGTLTLLSRRDPLLASWLDQGDTYSPPPWFLFSLYGPVLALAVIGAAWTVRRRTEPSAGSLAPVALWFVVVLGLIYVPVNFQRRFMEGWHIPVTMLAAVGWHRTIAPRLRPGVARRLLLVIGISVTLSPLFVLTDALVRALQTDNRHTYITAEEYDLLDRLDAEAGLDDVILAAFDNGNRFPARVGIRSVLGHWSLTAFADDRQDDVERFFDAATPESERIALLDRLGVDFVYVGEDERELGDFAPESVDYLVPVFVGREARLYRVALRPASE